MDLKYLEIIHSNCYQRCHNKRDPSYPYYGARGIKVCRRWRGKLGVAHFIKDVLRLIGPRPEGVLPCGLASYQLDRYPDTSGDYKPGNVRWATIKQNQSNRRTPRRKEKVPVISAAAMLTNVSSGMINSV